jgi:hypothetical protein
MYVIRITVLSDFDGVCKRTKPAADAAGNSSMNMLAASIHFVDGSAARTHNRC